MADKHATPVLVLPVALLACIRSLQEWLVRMMPRELRLASWTLLATGSIVVRYPVYSAGWFDAASSTDQGGYPANRHAGVNRCLDSALECIDH
jgi:hypothetical protein